MCLEAILFVRVADGRRTVLSWSIVMLFWFFVIWKQRPSVQCVRLADRILSLRCFILVERVLSRFAELAGRFPCVIREIYRKEISLTRQEINAAYRTIVDFDDVNIAARLRSLFQWTRRAWVIFWFRHLLWQISIGCQSSLSEQSLAVVIIVDKRNSIDDICREVPRSIAGAISFCCCSCLSVYSTSLTLD